MITDELKEKLPPTDSRLRPDMRLMEDGKMEEAGKIKHLLEEKQRERRKFMEKNK